MPNTLKGVRVNGENYHFDHDYLDNNPLPDNLPTTSTEVEEHSSSKVLVKLSGGGLQWMNVLPDWSGQSGKVLAVNSADQVEWRTVGSGGSGGLPSYDVDTDDGKVLTVSGNNDALYWGPVVTDVNIYDMLGTVPTADTADYFDYTLMTTGSDTLWVKSRVPPYDDTSDIGKVLTVLNDGTLGWEYPNAV